MMTVLASLIMSIVCSTLTSVWVPTISMGFPPNVEVVPYPPRITLGNDRFMALEERRNSVSDSYHKRSLNKTHLLTTHMMYERMAPEEPIRAPTIVMRLLSSKKPSAQSAHPE